MESQIENAIEIAWSPHSSQQLKEQAFQYLNDLRANPQGWEACLNLFVRRDPQPPSDVVRVVCLDVLNNVITLHDNPASFGALKTSLLEYIRRVYGGDGGDNVAADTPGIQNKLTQTLTCLFVRMYREGWETFLQDLMALTRTPGSNRPDNRLGCALYLRTLSSVHDEIADVLVNRQGDDVKRNVDLKDLIRERDMRSVVESWQSILAQYQSTDDEILEMALRVLGKWVSWIDIGLVINQEMLELLLPLVGRTGRAVHGVDKVRDAAVDAFTEMVAKKMKSNDKLELISFLRLRQITEELIASPPLNEYKKTSQYDVDLAEAVAKLINTILTDVVKILEQFDQSLTPKAEQQLHDFLPLLLRFFADEYDEVCSTVIPALTDVLTFMRKPNPLPTQYKDMLPSILNAVILKMRYDETSSWGNEDEQTDEAEFQDLRKRLQNLQKSVAAVDQHLYMETLSNLVANTFQTLDQQGNSMDWRDLDLALHEMYLFGELALPNQGIQGKNQPSAEASDRLLVIMREMVDSNIADFAHPAILLQYMEICVRYCIFFESNKAYIPRVLENFVKLVHHTHVRVRTRSWYLFHRFIRHLRADIGSIAETVVQSIGDLLVIKAEVSNDDANDDMSSDETDNSADAMFTAQLYLFEAVGCIASTPGIAPEKQVQYLTSVMQPLFLDLEQNLPRAKSGDAQAVLQIHHIIMALGTLAYGCADSPVAAGNSKVQPSAKPIADEFARAAEVILIALKELNSSSEIRTACRAAFSRLLGVLGASVLPQLPQWIEGLLSQSSSEDEMAMFLRLLEQIVYGFKGEIYEILNLLLTPLLQRIFTGLSRPANGTDDDIQLAELRREYLQFMGIILANDLGGVLVSEANQAYFETIISTILTMGRDISNGNLPTCRAAFGLLTRMTLVWNGADIAKVTTNPAPPSLTPAQQANTTPIPGFDNYVLQRFHPLCWEVLQDPAFKSSDAQSRQVINEMVNLEQVIYQKTGNAFVAQLQAPGGLFAQVGVPDARDEFMRLLSSDRKGLVRFLVTVAGGR